MFWWRYYSCLPKININTNAGLHVVINECCKHIYTIALCDVCVCLCTQDSWVRFFSSSFHATVPSLLNNYGLSMSLQENLTLGYAHTHTHAHRVIVYICLHHSLMMTWRPASVLILIYDVYLEKKKFMKIYKTVNSSLGQEKQGICLYLSVYLSVMFPQLYLAWTLTVPLQTVVC